jgi:hypothetical protein
MTKAKARPRPAPFLSVTASRLHAADAAWAAELAAWFGDEMVNAVSNHPAGRGEEGTKLRALYDARSRELTDWQRIRGLS